MVFIFVGRGGGEKERSRVNPAYFFSLCRKSNVGMTSDAIPGMFTPLTQDTGVLPATEALKSRLRAISSEHGLTRGVSPDVAEFLSKALEVRCHSRTRVWARREWVGEEGKRNALLSFYALYLTGHFSHTLSPFSFIPSYRLI